jgi:hypothetical protein
MRLMPNNPKGRLVGLASAGVLVGVFALQGLVPANATDGPAAEPAKNDKNLVTTWTAPKEASSGRVSAAAAPAQDNLEFVAFSTGCRVLDTRVAGGAFTANSSRDIGVRDASLPVGLGPCGVPARAKAIQLSISTIGGSPAAAGYARVGPGGVAPTATVLQYVAGQGTSNTTTVPLNASTQFRLFSSAAAGYVGDVLGYWQAPLWGRVAANGTLTSGSGVTSISKSTAFAGDYYIYFDRTVSPGCAPATMLEDSNTRVLGYVSSTYLYVDVRNYASAAEQDGSFSFIVQC